MGSTTPASLVAIAGLALLRQCVRLPYPGLLRLGKAVGWLSYLLMTRRRHIAAVNIRLCFPDLNPTEHRQVLRDSFLSMGMSIFETALSWWGEASTLAPLCHLQGLQHLQLALAQRQGVLLLSAHFTCLEIGGRLLAEQQAFAVMYKPNRNPVIEAAIKTARQTHYQAAISQDDLRGFVRALKQGLACWYAPDQDLGEQRSVYAPFFSIPAATITAPARFAKLSGARVVPFFALRRADGTGYDLHILPPLEHFPSTDPVADASRINALIEQYIRLAPAQYLWMHRRFKTRPAGAANVYYRS